MNKKRILAVKFLSFIVVACLFMAVMTAVGCAKHEHSFSDNHACHDRVCSCGYTVKATALHTLGDTYSCHDRTCSVCGDVVKATTEHTLAETEREKCESTTCIICKDLVAGAEPHAFSDTFVIYDATCLKNGLFGKICSVCGQTESEVLPAFGHDFDENGVCLNGCGINKDGSTGEHTVHSYLHDITCIDRACVVCGEVTRATGKHVFKNDKDCLDKVCVLCDYEIKGSGTHAFATGAFSCRDNVCSDCGERVNATTEHIFNSGACACGYKSIEQDFTFTPTPSGYAVTAYVGSDEYVAIPKTYKGRQVVEISARAFKSTALKGVYVPNTVVKIGNNAFDGSAFLKEVCFPAFPAVSEIGESAFKDCVSLEYLFIPKRVTGIKFETFKNCSSLKKLVVPETIKRVEANAFVGCKLLERFDFSESLEFVGENAFYNCSSLKSAIFDKNSAVINIYPNTFYNCTALSSLILPENTLFIGENAFYNCTALTSLTIPNSVKQLHTKAFDKCYKLLHVRNLSDQAFTALNPDCEVLNSGSSDFKNQITFSGDGVIEYNNGGNIYLLGYVGNDAVLDLTEYAHAKEIYDYAFYNLSVQKVILPDGLNKIGEYAFKDCYYLSEVEIGFDAQLEVVGKEAFSGCAMLVEITIPENVTVIEAGALFNCNRLVNIRNLSGLTLKGLNNAEMQIVTDKTTAFTNEIKLEGGGKFITLKAGSKTYLLSYSGLETELDLTQLGITDVYAYAFDGNTNIKSVVLPAGLKSVGDMAFRGCTSLESITVPASVSVIGKFAFADSSLKSVTFTGGSVLTEISAGAFENCVNLSSVEIPKSVLTIGARAFYGCKSLVTLAFEANSTLTEIKGSAFYSCESLSAINLPASVKKVGAYAFNGCKAATEFKFGNGSDALIERIGDYAFYDCVAFSTLDFGKYGNLKLIGEYAFSTCTEATSIIIPVTVTTELNAFQSCKKMAKLYYLGTSEQFALLLDNDLNNGEIYGDNIAITNPRVKRYFYSANTPMEEGYFWRYDSGVITEWE